MKKGLLYTFIVVDMALVAICSIFLLQHLTTPLHRPLVLPNPMTSIPTTTSSSTNPMGNRPVNVVLAPVIPSQNTAMPPSMVKTMPAPRSAPPLTPNTMRKIGFSYHNARAHKVMIHADFLGWKAELMQKDLKNNMWKYTASLLPGNYDYYFSVDDKNIPDPANKKTKKIGKIPVSTIVVKPFATLNSHP